MASRFEQGLTAYRIADARYPIFDGGGAVQQAGRWHAGPRRIIYAGQSYAIALLEKLVQARGAIPASQRVIEITASAITVEKIGIDEVDGWASDDPSAARAYGNAWYDGGLAGERPPVLIVPSAVTRLGYDCNVLINQQHAEFSRLAASEPRGVYWDRRLFA